MAYFCQKCGEEFDRLRDMLGGYCSEGGHHQAYRGHEHGPFHCGKCGDEFDRLRDLLGSYCSEGGHHQPF